jgi:hypothetical protein
MIGRMQKGNWENWLSLSSTLAVVVGVALVVLQLRQNAELLELQILKQDADNRIQASMESMPENIYEIRLKAIREPENLTQLEYHIMDGYLWYRTIERWQSLYDLAERGLLDETSWKQQVHQDAGVMLANPFGRAYWSRMKDIVGTLPSDLKNFVDDVLADLAPNHANDAYVDVLRRLEAEN